MRSIVSCGYFILYTIIWRHKTVIWTQVETSIMCPYTLFAWAGCEYPLISSNISNELNCILSWKKIGIVPTPWASRWETAWWTKSNFLSLIPKSGKDQWDSEISNTTFIEWVFSKTLLGYTVSKAYATPRNSTWFTRLFLLMRG